MHDHVHHRPRRPSSSAAHGDRMRRAGTIPVAAADDGTGCCAFAAIMLVVSATAPRSARQNVVDRDALHLGALPRPPQRCPPPGVLAAAGLQDVAEHDEPASSPGPADRARRRPRRRPARRLPSPARPPRSARSPCACRSTRTGRGLVSSTARTPCHGRSVPYLCLCIGAGPDGRRPRPRPSAGRDRTVVLGEPMGFRAEHAG